MNVYARFHVNNMTKQHGHSRVSLTYSLYKSNLLKHISKYEFFYGLIFWIIIVFTLTEVYLWRVGL